MLYILVLTPLNSYMVKKYMKKEILENDNKNVFQSTALTVIGNIMQL